MKNILNCNGYCSQCKQNKSCHFSTRIKNNKTQFREWFERQSHKEQIMKYEVGQRVFYQGNYGMIYTGIIKEITTGIISGEPIYRLDSGKSLPERELLDSAIEFTSRAEDFLLIPKPDISRFIRDTIELGKCTVPDIEDVIFNGPATIIKFKNGSKSVVKCDAEDKQNKDIGFLMALVKSIVKKNSYDMILKTMEQYKENNNVK